MFDLNRYRKGALLGCTIILSTLMLVLTQPASSVSGPSATTWTVNTTTDPGAPTCVVTCSLRAAVNNAAPGDLIGFDAAVFSVPLTINLNGQIEIFQSLTIDGVAGGGITPTLSGNHISRVIQVDAGANVILHALNIIDGYSISGGGVYNSGWLSITSSTLTKNETSDGGSSLYASGGAGGGIFNGGTLFLADSVVGQNQTGRGSNSSPAGPGGAGGGIYNTGTLTIANSSVSWNVTGDGGMSGGGLDGNGGMGGGIYNLGTLVMLNSQLSKNKTGNGSGDTFRVSTIGGAGGAGGGAYNAGTLSMMGSSVIGNRTGQGGDSYTCSFPPCNRWGGEGGSGGGIYNVAILSMTSSLVSDNATGSGGHDGNSNANPGNHGGDGGSGGGVVNHGALFMMNDTIIGNQTGNGGPGYTGGNGGRGGGVFSTLSLSMTHSTINGNATGSGGPGYITGTTGSGVGIYWLGSVILKSTVIANGASDANCSVPSFQADGGYNLDSGNTCGFTATHHSLINTDPLLGSLGDYGGPVQTVPLLSGSQAIDAIPFGENGCGTVVTTDARGVYRPQGTACDIGAYEYDSPGLAVIKWANPDPVRSGEQLTYTIRVTNNYTEDLHATITDVLPAHIIPSGIFTWTPVISASGGMWQHTFVVTAALGYAGLLANVVQVTTLEGATGIYTATTQAQVPPALTVTKQANSTTVRAGELLTYTIRITNTGNITLTGIVTDTLPAQVTPTGVQTWTLTNLPPGDVWAQPIAVTVAQGYSDTLINRVQVTTQEGARGETQVSVNAIGYQVYLPIVLK